MSVSSISSTESAVVAEDCLKRWVEMDESLRALKEEERELRAQQKELEPAIMEFMRESEKTKLNLAKSGISLELVTKTQKQPVSMRNLTGFLTNFFEGDVVKANSATRFVDSQRASRTTEHLVRKIITTSSKK
jgi:hypothetical protein